MQYNQEHKWTHLEAFFLYPQITDFQIVVSLYPNKPYINGKLIYSAFRLCINLNFINLTHVTVFVVQGHIYIQMLIN